MQGTEKRSEGKVKLPWASISERQLRITEEGSLEHRGFHISQNKINLGGEKGVWDGVRIHLLIPWNCSNFGHFFQHQTKTYCCHFCSTQLCHIWSNGPCPSTNVSIWSRWSTLYKTHSPSRTSRTVLSSLTPRAQQRKAEAPGAPDSCPTSSPTSYQLILAAVQVMAIVEDILICGVQTGLHTILYHLAGSGRALQFLHLPINKRNVGPGSCSPGWDPLLELPETSADSPLWVSGPCPALKLPRQLIVRTAKPILVDP